MGRQTPHVQRFDEWVRSQGVDPDPRFTLANERTFLSWMTTCLGLLGIGLAVGSLAPAGATQVRIVGALWIVLSAVLAVRSVFRWFRLERAMRRGHALPLSASIPVVALAIGLLAVVSGIVVGAAR